MRIRSAVAIVALTLLAPAGSAQSDKPAVFASSLSWSVDDPHFGGWSGLELTPDGRGFVTISDKGWIMTGRIKRADDLGIIGVEPGPIRPMKHTDGGRFPRYYNDSEGLALAGDGRLFVSFESKDRIEEYDDSSADLAHELPDYAPFHKFSDNAALESLAIGPDGAIYTIPEVPLRRGQPFPVYRFKNGAWSRIAGISRPDDFRISGADIGPDGRLYVLERLFVGFFGFASRVRRFDFTPDGLSVGTVMFRSAAGTYDNLEGLSVWRDQDGHIRLTMISDDNFKFFQTTEFVEYVAAE